MPMDCLKDLNSERMILPPLYTDLSPNDPLDQVKMRSLLLRDWLISRQAHTLRRKLQHITTMVLFLSPESMDLFVMITLYSSK